MKRIVLTGIALALAMPALSGAQGTTMEIATGDDFFDPENVSSDVGAQSYHWQWGAPLSQNEHNVREDNKIFYSGKLAVDGQFALNPSAGTFHYYCEAHGFAGGGMDGELKVKPTALRDGKTAIVTWATEQSDSGNQYDVQMKVGSNKPKLVEEKTTDLFGEFKLKSGKKYQFQVRSRQGKKTSDFSPKLKLTG